MIDQVSLFEQERRQEEKEAKKKAPRGRRSLELIADFDKDGFAKGWHFKVSTAFRDELDIKYMERKEPVLDENGEVVKEPFIDKNGNAKLKKDGTPRMRRKTKAVMKWTQGQYYCFSEGHVIHGPDFLIQISRATQNTLNDDGRFKTGFVSFTVCESQKGGEGLESKGQYHLTQNEFVEYLKTGLMKEGAEDLKA